MVDFIDSVEGESVRFVLNGELVAGGMDRLRSALTKYIDSGIKHIEFDMAKVSTLDSAGIGFLASAHNSLSKYGGMIKVTRLSGDIYNFFVSLRLNTHFHIEQRK